MIEMGLQTAAWAPHVTCACCGTWWAVLHHLPQSPSKKVRAYVQTFLCALWQYGSSWLQLSMVHMALLMAQSTCPML